MLFWWVEREILAQIKFWKLRNTLCISKFSTGRAGAKDPLKSQKGYFSGCLNKKIRESWRKSNIHGTGNNSYNTLNDSTPHNVTVRRIFSDGPATRPGEELETSAAYPFPTLRPPAWWEKVLMHAAPLSIHFFFVLLQSIPRTSVSVNSTVVENQQLFRTSFMHYAIPIFVSEKDLRFSFPKICAMIGKTGHLDWKL